MDLGSSQTICQVSLNWETAYAKAFQIQTSPDGTNWTTIYSTTTGTGGIQTLNVSGHRPLRAHERHGARHPVRLLAVGVRRIHHGTGGSGTGGNTVTVTNPGSQTSTIGTAVSQQISAHGLRRQARR